MIHMVIIFSTIVKQCNYNHYLPLYILVFIVSGGVRHSHAGFKLPTNAQGIHRKPH